VQKRLLSILSYINRLRLGHCRLTHTYLMSGDDQPVRESCGLPAHS